MKLVRFDEIVEKQYNEMMDEWEAEGVRINPYAVTRGSRSFEELVKEWEWNTKEAVRKKGLVPATLYFLSDENGRLYGAIHLRHELNEHLRHFGGHIGYGIRPSERRKGYATLQLKLMMDKLKEMGYKKVMITCDVDNIASEKTILKNGGQLEGIVDYDKGRGKVFWIEL